MLSHVKIGPFANPTFNPEIAIELEQWCKDNCVGRYVAVTTSKFTFEVEDDAKRFKEKFCNE